MKRKSFQFDLNKCVGCHACVVACTIENQTLPETQWREISSFNASVYPDIPVLHFSLACNHCEDAPCMKNCPALAYSKDLNTGAIIHFADKCIGCKYCTWACPYDAPKYNLETKLIEKCTFCNHRIEDNLKPACANLCPTGALDFIDKPDDLSHQNIPGFTDIGIKPSVKIISQNAHKPKLIVSENQMITKQKPVNESNSKITFIKEWPLAIFTIVATLLISAFTASVLGSFKINPYLFVFAGITASILSLLHLGKKFRAWRSVLNLKNSWLSREIFFFTGFLLLSFIHFFYYNHEVINYMCIASGIIALFSIDKVYKLALQIVKFEIHSAHVLLSYFLFTALFLENYYALTFIIAIKISLYVYRKFEIRKQAKNYRLLLSSLRLDLLVSLPLLFWIFGISNIFWWLAASILLGEFIDRAEYYEELDVITPEKQIERDLDTN